ncbi:MAG: vitamin B12-dependent ribonucleotide reductase, partial [Planctomycetota bacterium]
MARRKKTLKIERVFCKNGDPYKSVSWSNRDITKEAKDGTIIFQQKKVDMPEDWSDRAAFIAASKYFRGHIGKPNRETSLKQLFDRVVDTITKKGLEYGYFDAKNAKVFASELKWLLVHQRIAFNSPVFFNVGAVEEPQGSACFILGVEDNLESIVDLQKAEAVLFSQGSGAGSNLSKLRGSGEPLSRGGWASGPISFMKGYDAWAGIIRSGGVQRRASKMQRLDDDHPDVWNGKDNGTDFITWKSHEEKKA